MSDELKQIVSVSDEVVTKIKENQPEEKTLNELAEFFKVFGDFTRVRILYALMERELCVNDMCTVLNMKQSAVSHQLRILKDAKLVKVQKKGKVSAYSLDDDHIRTLLSVGMNHINEE